MDSTELDAKGVHDTRWIEFDMAVAALRQVLFTLNCPNAEIELELCVLEAQRRRHVQLIGIVHGKKGAGDPNA